MKKNIFSFRQFLVKSLFWPEFYSNSLIQAQLICVNNSFLYLDVGGKTTLIKPKLKKFCETFMYNEILLIWNKPFFKIMLIITLKNLIKELFHYNFLKFKNFFPWINRGFFVGSLCLKKLSVYNKHLKKFIIIELKKIFFQFFKNG